MSIGVPRDPYLMMPSLSMLGLWMLVCFLVLWICRERKRGS